ncbi:MAG: MarR family winged helix-turn-helix transcriptional regulator [Hominisplanchenecus sp.]
MQKRYESLDINNKLIWNFRDIGHTLRQLSGGKGGQKRILILLNETGVITQRELTERLGIQPGSVSEVIGKLEAAGLLTRTPSETDRRTTDIRLTEAGSIQATEARDSREKRHIQMFSCLSEQEKEDLLLLLEKVNSAWDSQYRSVRREDEDSKTERAGGMTASYSTR